MSDTSTSITPTIVVPSPLAWDLGLLLATELRKRGYDPLIRCSPEVALLVASYNFRPTEGPERTRRMKVAEELQKRLVFLFFSKRFSNQWSNKWRQVSRPGRLNRLSNLYLPLPRSTWPFAQRVIRWVSGTLAGSSGVKLAIIISPLWRSVEILHPRTRVISVVDSWDHAVKFPYGCWSDHVISWNQDLCDQWAARQGSGRTHVGYPHKVAYADGAEIPSTTVGDDVSRAVKTLMYAMSLGEGEDGFEEELELVSLIETLSATKGISLTIKPHPLKTHNPEKISSVATQSTVLATSAPPVVSNPFTPTDYSLTADYNRQRLTELQTIDAVIAWGTTFVLDTAVAEVPTIQLDLRHAHWWTLITKFAHNDHLSELLYSRGDGAIPISSPEDLARIFETLQTGGLERATRFSQDLKEWLIGDRTQEGALREFGDLVDQIVKDLQQPRRRWMPWKKSVTPSGSGLPVEDSQPNVS